jgi:ligand-binding sensor domain-containing protein/signal transduction histidine kinase
MWPFYRSCFKVTIELPEPPREALMNLKSALLRLYKTLKAIGIALIPLCVHAQAPTLKFNAYNINNGLSQNEVFAIIQDKQGFIWLGTDEGLNRFDGYEFKIFKHDAKNPNSIIDNSIHSLEVGDDGTLWIGTSNGISRYYPDTEKIEQLQTNTEDDNSTKRPNGTGVNEIKKDKKGNIWIAYLGSGVDFYDVSKKEFFHYSEHRPDAYKIKNDYAIAIQIMPDGSILLGTREGIEVIDPKGIPVSDGEARIKYPWKNSIDKSINSFQLSADEQTLWLSTELNGFYRINLKTNVVKNYNTGNSNLSFNNNVPSIFEDSKGQVWVGGELIYRVGKNDELVPYDEHGVSNPGNTVLKNPILCIFEDKDNNIWFGTFRLGVLKYHANNIQIMHFHNAQGNASIQNNQVLSFNQDLKKNIWVGTDGGGLYKLRANYSGVDIAPGSNKFSSQAIKCIYTDKDGYFWLGTWDGGLMKYHPERHTVELLRNQNKDFYSRHVWDIKGDSLGNLWIATLRDGLCHYSPKTNKITYYKSTLGDSSSLVNDDVLSLLIDSQNILWVGTSNGLCYLRPGQKKFTNMQQENYPNINLNVLSLYEDSNKRIWIGSNGGGITIIDKNLKVIKTLTEKEGLPSSTICAMQTDQHQNLWISTYNGLIKINEKDFSITQIPEIAGLQGNQFIPKASFLTSSRQLLFGGVNGFNLFYPDSLKFNLVPKKVIFTSLKILNDEINPVTKFDNRKILNRSITETNEINLSYKDYSFSISFSPLVYNWQNALHYSYFLENLDQEWQYTSADRRLIHYTNLAPGKYILNVKSSFDGTHWPDEATQLVINIVPPWYATSIFKISAICFLAILLYAIYILRIRFLSNQKKKLEELVLLRTHELEKSTEEIQALLKEVAKQKKDIEEKNQELYQINEELASQNDVLEEKSNELQNAQSNLREVNTNLELLVNGRTKKLNETLLELETFLYRASHDLRGPISSMLGLIQISEMESKSNPNNVLTQFQYKSIIKLERTLQKLMQKYTILKSEIIPQWLTKDSLNEMLNHVTRDLPTFRPKDFDVIIDETVQFETDKTMLRIIFTNLLDNAFFFSTTAVNKEVSLLISKNQSNVIITVTDHGPGIKRDVRDKIFTMFYRGHELSTGNGLGLYLVKNALTRINGEIKLETEEGKFSRFIVRL